MVFEEELAAYKHELTDEIKKLCEELSDLNVRAGRLVQAVYKEKFQTVEL